jgi:hypothetical protein
MPERQGSSAWNDVLANPSGQVRLIQRAAGKRQDESDDLFFGSLEAEAIQAKDEVHRLEGDALVPIDEGMVLGETEAVPRGEGGKVGARVVGEPVPRPLQGRRQEATVAEAEGATVCLDLIIVDGEDVHDREPARLDHFAS